LRASRGSALGRRPGEGEEGFEDEDDDEEEEDPSQGYLAVTA
jgi:hypothetical protein